jgi:hypothetical protein
MSGTEQIPRKNLHRFRISFAFRAAARYFTCRFGGTGSPPHVAARLGSDWEEAHTQEFPMHSDHEDGFLVFLRADRAHPHPPDAAEQPVTCCASYEDARRIQREYRRISQECVIRYLGESGGGD